MRLDPFTVMSALVLEDGRTWGDAAEDLQLEDARAVIEGPEPYHYWTRSRGRAKTSDAAGVALALLVAAAPPAARIYVAAADADQAGLAHDSVVGYVDRTPLLQGQVSVQARKVTMVATGASLEVLASDAASSWGLRPWMTVVDEFSAWPETPGPRRFWESLSSAVAKLTDARLLVVTSAGDPRHLSYSVLEHARISRLWRTSEAEGSSPWMSADRLAEQRARLPEAIFKQLFENVWLESEGAFLDPEAVKRAFLLPGPSEPIEGRSYFGALDIGLVNDRTVLAVGHREAGGAAHLDLMQSWRGTRKAPVDLGEVRDAIIRAHERYGLRRLIFDKWQAHRLAEELGAAGIACSPYEFTGPSKQRYSAALLQTLNEGSLRLYEPGGLEEELRGLTIRTTGSGWSFDHGRRGHDDMAVSLSLLILELLTERPATATSFSYMPTPASRVTISRAGLTLTGDRYLDRDDSDISYPYGRRTAARRPPPGWSEGRRP